MSSSGINTTVVVSPSFSGGTNQPTAFPWGQILTESAFNRLKDLYTKFKPLGGDTFRKFQEILKADQQPQSTETQQSSTNPTGGTNQPPPANPSNPEINPINTFGTYPNTFGTYSNTFGSLAPTKTIYQEVIAEYGDYLDTLSPEARQTEIGKLVAAKQASRNLTEEDRLRRTGYMDEMDRVVANIQKFATEAEAKRTENEERAYRNKAANPLEYLNIVAKKSNPVLTYGSHPINLIAPTTTQVPDFAAAILSGKTKSIS